MNKPPFSRWARTPFGQILSESHQHFKAFDLDLPKRRNKAAKKGPKQNE